MTSVNLDANKFSVGCQGKVLVMLVAHVEWKVVKTSRLNGDKELIRKFKVQLFMQPFVVLGQIHKEAIIDLVGNLRLLFILRSICWWEILERILSSCNDGQVVQYFWNVDNF